VDLAHGTKSEEAVVANMEVAVVPTAAPAAWLWRADVRPGTITGGKMEP
jgi:hypothetical protein